MVKWFLSALFIPLQLFAATGAVFEVDNLTPAQALAAENWVKANAPAGISYLIEYTPVAGTTDLDQNQLRLSFSAESDALVNNARNVVRNRLNQLGWTISLDAEVASLRDALIVCFNAHGLSLANRPAMKTCALAAWRSASRVQTKEERMRLLKNIRDRGLVLLSDGTPVRNLRQLREWLNETE